MPRTAINELTDGAVIEQSFRVGDKQLRVNRQGGKYIILKLADKSGTMVAMLWNADETVFDSFDRGDFVFCRGRTQVHNGALQVIATGVERMDPAEVEMADFERFDAEAANADFAKLTRWIDSLQNGSLRALGEAYLADAPLMSRLKKSAAAVSNHHAYPGGLLRHTVDLIELCDVIGPRYDELDTELLGFGAFLHDLGKIEELAADGEITYTDRGQLIGHIVIGIQLLGDKIRGIEGFPVELRHQLEHLIASHHGQLEFGSPKVPMTLEAVALHHIDNLDAKLTSYANLIDTDVAADGNWTNYIPAIGRKLWKG